MILQENDDIKHNINYKQWPMVEIEKWMRVLYCAIGRMVTLVQLLGRLLYQMEHRYINWYHCMIFTDSGKNIKTGRSDNVGNVDIVKCKRVSIVSMSPMCN